MGDDKIAILVKRASLEFEKMANPFLAEHGLTHAQYRVLKYLYLHPGEAVRSVDIEHYYSLTHPTAIGLLDALEKKGYIERRPNPTDGRSRLIALTEKAAAEQESLVSLGSKLEEMFTSNLTNDERAQLVSLLRRLGPQKR